MKDEGSSDLLVEFGLGDETCRATLDRYDIPSVPSFHSYFEDTFHVKQKYRIDQEALSIYTATYRVSYRQYTGDMDQRIFENVSRIAVNSKPPQPFVQQPYAFTELININWSTPVRLDHASTSESQLWTRTIKTYSDHPGTTNIWYGQMVDTPLIFKLIIDWVSPDDYRAFHQSTAFAELLQAWQASPTPITTDSQQFFTFPMDQRFRSVAFQLPRGGLPDVVTVFVSAHFSPDWDPDAIEPLDRQPQRPRKAVWDNAWMLFRDAALKSEGGYVSDKATEGWSVAEMNGQKSHISVIRFQDFRTASQFLKSAEDPTSAHASFDRLKQFAQGGVVAEVVTMKPLEPMAG